MNCSESESSYLQIPSNYRHWIGILLILNHHGYCTIGSVFQVSYLMWSWRCTQNNQQWVILQLWEHPAQFLFLPRIPSLSNQYRITQRDTLLMRSVTEQLWLMPESQKKGLYCDVWVKSHRVLLVSGNQKVAVNPSYSMEHLPVIMWELNKRKGATITFKCAANVASYGCIWASSILLGGELFWNLVVFSYNLACSLPENPELLDSPSQDLGANLHFQLTLTFLDLFWVHFPDVSYLLIFVAWTYMKLMILTRDHGWGCWSCWSPPWLQHMVVYQFRDGPGNLRIGCNRADSPSGTQMLHDALLPI